MIDKIVLIITSVCFIFACIILLKKNKGRILISTDNIVVFVFLVLFGVVFPFDYFYAVLNPSGGKNNYLILISTYSSTEILLYYFCILLFLITFVLVYRRFSKKNIVTENHNDVISSGKETVILLSSAILLIIGVVSDRLYLSAYGSYANYLNYSGLLRSGVMSVYNRWSFLIVFRGCVTVSCFLLFGILLKTKKTPLKILLFVFAFIYSLFILYANKGRLSFILFLLMFPVLYIYIKQKNKDVNFKLLFMFALLGGVFVLLIVMIGSLLSRSSNTNLLLALANETAFVFGNFKALLSNSFEYRYFSDVISYPIFLLPSSWWRNIYPSTASDICTFVVNGAYKGTDGVLGESPCDIISFCYLQFGIIGAPFIAAFYGFFMSRVLNAIRSIKCNYFKKTVVLYVVVYGIIQSIPYADPYNIVQRMFPGFVFLIIYLFVSFLIKSNPYKLQIQ